MSRSRKNQPFYVEPYDKCAGGITQELVRREFIYDEFTGSLVNRVYRGSMALEGAECGCKVSDGRIIVGICGKQIEKSKLIWLYEFGTIPKYVDHLNGDFNDYRKKNLKEVVITGTRELSFDEAHYLFKYNFDTGILIHRTNSGSAKAGDQAGALRPSGYMTLTVRQKSYLVHRVIWFMVYGVWPNIIDHINGDPSDNRFANIRSVTSEDNSKNSKRNSLNTSGIMGVCYRKDIGKWAASIGVKNKKKHLGVFDTKLEAAQMRRKAERWYGFHENHGRRK